MYYLAYSKLSNRLVDISITEISPDPLIIVESRAGDMPDLARWEWNPSILDWSPRAIRVVNQIDFMRRFADTELATIYTVAKTNIAVEVWLARFKSATEINLDDPLTISGMQALESAGLIGVGRASEILA